MADQHFDFGEFRHGEKLARPGRMRKEMGKET
jgi:hypothetical protein